MISLFPPPVLSFLSPSLFLSLVGLKSLSGGFYISRSSLGGALHAIRDHCQSRKCSKRRWSILFRHRWISIYLRVGRCCCDATLSQAQRMCVAIAAARVRKHPVAAVLRWTTVETQDLNFEESTASRPPMIYVSLPVNRLWHWYRTTPTMWPPRFQLPLENSHFNPVFPLTVFVSFLWCSKMWFPSHYRGTCTDQVQNMTGNACTLKRTGLKDDHGGWCSFQRP